MKDGTSSILYIIISVIIILVGILGKKKKPQQIPGSSSGEETGGMSFFEKLGFKDEDKEDFFDIEEEKTDEVGDKEQHETSFIPTFENQSDKKAEVTEKVFEEKTEEVDAYEILDEYDNELNEIKDEFDLKKAVIYSEIINRKYV